MLITCPECGGKEMSDQAYVCPNCGVPTGRVVGYEYSSAGSL